jgi:hypothetical protein
MDYNILQLLIVLVTLHILVPLVIGYAQYFVRCPSVRFQYLVVFDISYPWR